MSFFTTGRVQKQEKGKGKGVFKYYVSKFSLILDDVTYLLHQYFAIILSKWIKEKEVLIVSYNKLNI